jgi:dihydroorotate dehydrogenase electron transfer subunit
LGKPFRLDDDFETALLVGGGIGVAPLPLTAAYLRSREKRMLSFIGARRQSQLVTMGLDNVVSATDDGSVGFHGTVVECLRAYVQQHDVVNPKIFSCGPNRMLKAIADLALESNIACEVSLESEMACGIGICQGCPIERANGERKYYLVCKDGPCFDAREVFIHT